MLGPQTDNFLYARHMRYTILHASTLHSGGVFAFSPQNVHFGKTHFKHVRLQGGPTDHRQLRRYRTRLSRFNGDPENVHFGKTH